MKKLFASIFCIFMLLSLISCQSDIGQNNYETAGAVGSDTAATDPNASSDNKANEIPVNYKEILDMYRSINEILAKDSNSMKTIDSYCDELGIVDEGEKELFVRLYRSSFDFNFPHYQRSCGYATKDLNDDGVDELVLLNDEYTVVAVFSYSDGKPVLLGNYMDRDSCWIDGDGLLHENGSGGADHSTNAIYKIADGGKELELIVEYGTNGHEWIEDVAYTIYYKLVDGEKVTITEAEYNDLSEQYDKYLGSDAGAAATKEYSGLTFTSLFTEAEIAMEMYEAAIHDEICVFDERFGEIELKNLRFTSNDTSLDECKLLKKAILDIDQDGVNEYVIQSPNQEYVILHYYNGNVYSYWLDTGDFYNFNTDGSFHWYDSSEAEGLACGLNKIIFDGETLNEKSIYSLKFSKNPTKYEYFVEGEAVTEDEYDSYRAHNIRYKRMKFSQFELTHFYPITAEQALNLANAYWDNQDGCAEGDLGSVYTARIVLIDTPNSDTDYYRVAFQVECNTGGGLKGYECMPPHNIQLKDQILVNAFTGEIIASTYEPDGKVVSVEEAIEIAKKYSMECDACNEENIYRVEYAPDANAPDHVYVIVIQKYDIYRNRIWIDKNTGKPISPYYLYGKG